MNGLAEVIPLSSRRPRRKGSKAPPPKTPPASGLSDATRRRRALVFAGGLLALLAVLMVGDRFFMHGGAVAQAPAGATLPAAIRQGLFARTMADVVASCGLAEARAGILRQHCVDQARLLSELPECDVTCGRLTRAILQPR